MIPLDCGGGHSTSDLARVFATNVGFYRPLVTTSFAIDRAIWDLDPLGYAITNLVLLLADAAILFLLARRLMLPSPAALFAVAAWMFNFHGINMALLWISGRTALLLCLFSLSAVLTWISGNRELAALLTFAALLCRKKRSCCATSGADRLRVWRHTRHEHATYTPSIVAALDGGRALSDSESA